MRTLQSTDSIGYFGLLQTLQQFYAVIMLSMMLFTVKTRFSLSKLIVFEKTIAKFTGHRMETRYAVLLYILLIQLFLISESHSTVHTCGTVYM